MEEGGGRETLGTGRSEGGGREGSGGITSQLETCTSLWLFVFASLSFLSRMSLRPESALLRFLPQRPVEGRKEEGGRGKRGSEWTRRGGTWLGACLVRRLGERKEGEHIDQETDSQTDRRTDRQNENTGR